jgi:arginine exporter protein ArgO
MNAVANVVVLWLMWLGIAVLVWAGVVALGHAVRRAARWRARRDSLRRFGDPWVPR